MPTLWPPALKFLPSTNVLNANKTPGRIFVWNPRPITKKKLPLVIELSCNFFFRKLMKKVIYSPIRLSLLILARTLEFLSNEYCAPMPNLVALDPEVHANWTPAFKSSLTLWKIDPLNSWPSFLHFLNWNKKNKIRYQMNQ